MVIALATSVPFVREDRPRPAAAPAENTPVVESPVSGLRIVNWYPADRGWTNLWTNWDASVVSADFARIASLHANGVRVIVFPDVFGYPTPTAEMMQRLSSTVDLAQHAGLRVQLTLFDWFSDWNDVAGSQQWAAEVLSPFVGDPRIAFVEVRNQIDPTDPAALAWTREMVPSVQSVMHGVPVTISTSSERGVDGLVALRVALAAVPPTFYDFHYFGDPAFARITLSQAKSAVAPAPLYIGGFGFSTVDANRTVAGLAAGAASLEAWQDYQLRTVQRVVSELGLPAASPWTVYDFAPGAIPPVAPSGVAEYGFGLFRADGSPKSSATSLAAIFAGRPAATEWNEGFESPVEGPEGVLPALWRRFRTDATYGWDGAGARSGTGSAMIRDSGGDVTGAPAFYLTPVAPGIVSGQTYAASVWARGDAATGKTRVALAWFDADHEYLGQRESSLLPTGTTAWTRLSVEADAPPGASTVEVHLKSAYNEGTVRFDDVTFSAA